MKGIMKYLRKLFESKRENQNVLKFCCAKFDFFYSGKKTMGLNVRIIGFGKTFKERAQLNIDRNFIITDGYSGEIEDCPKKMVINFCPFCGANLRTFYKNDDYIQEIMN